MAVIDEGKGPARNVDEPLEVEGADRGGVLADAQHSAEVLGPVLVRREATAGGDAEHGLLDIRQPDPRCQRIVREKETAAGPGG
ncbi:hypothetical protein ABZ572_36715 [Streptomyces sp. NPDC018338]|uniref:hypothetical protein n=1 Tax=Streptomyces sp. NPDC018338 TaxID=3157192 RepID=UPI0033F72199